MKEIEEEEKEEDKKEEEEDGEDNIMLSQSNYIDHKSKIGFFNDKNQYCLTKEDLPFVNSYFNLLYLNRI